MEWEAVPEGTESFIVIFFDEVDPNIQHWLLYNIPSSIRSVAEGINFDYPSNISVVRGSYSGTSYWGPNPSSSSSKSYTFAILAVGQPTIRLTVDDDSRLPANLNNISWGDSNAIGYAVINYITGVVPTLIYGDTTYEVLGSATLRGIASP